MNRKEFNILIVDDEQEFRQTLSMIVEGAGYKTMTAANSEEALRIIDGEDEVNLMLTDLRMPGMSGIELIREARIRNPKLEIIVITAYGTIESAVEAVKVGAGSYFVKSEDPMNLLADIHRVYEIYRLTRENELLKKQDSPTSEFFLETKNSKYAEILEICRKAADSNINVLILGESGVGKEIIAKYIHQNSSRVQNVLCRSTASDFRTEQSNPNCLDMKKAHLPAHPADASADLKKRTKALYFWTKLEIFHSQHKGSCCEPSKTELWSVLEVISRLHWIFV